MERLTERNKNGLSMAACCGKACEYNYVCEVGGFGECRGMDDIIDRLADIEDILGDDYNLDLLRELVQADRDGRCVVLPCKVGDKVFQQNGVDIFENQVKKIIYDCGHFAFDEETIGERVFLIRESAEAALKGEQA